MRPIYCTGVEEKAQIEPEWRGYADSDSAANLKDRASLNSNQASKGVLPLLRVLP